MPDAVIVHHTDTTTAPIAGVDDVVRLECAEPSIVFRMEHHAREKGEFIALDVDVILQSDLSEVLAMPFDVALVRSDAKRTHQGFDCGRYCGGLMISRNSLFWRDIITEAMTEDERLWSGCQRAMDEVSKHYKTLELPESIYGYVPSGNESWEGKKAVHLKGRVKDMYIEVRK